MASVFQREDSKFWWASFKTPAGKWVCKSTKTTNQADARRLAFLWEGAGATLALETPAGAQVDRVVRQMWEQFTGRRIEPSPVRGFCATWLARMKTTRSEHTAERYRKPVDDFVKFLGDQADHDMRSISTADLQRFIDAEAAAGKSATTVSLNAKVLRAVFNTAVRAGAIERNPAGMLEVADAVHEERQPFTQGELNSLLTAAAGTDWETAILLGAFSGLRIGDATSLKWDSVDLAKGVICFVPQKTSRKKKELTIPMHPKLRHHLDTLASQDEAQKSVFLCPLLAGREVGGRAGLSSAFIEEIMKPAGVDTKRGEAAGKGHKMPHKSFHSLRHFFVSGMANAGVSVDVRRKLAGHSDEKQTARYSHLEMKTLRKAVGTLSKGKK
jgi:integrase